MSCIYRRQCDLLYLLKFQGLITIASVAFCQSFLMLMFMLITYIVFLAHFSCAKLKVLTIPKEFEPQKWLCVSMCTIAVTY